MANLVSGLPDGEDPTVIAFYYGASSYPGPYLNLLANPEAKL